MIRLLWVLLILSSNFTELRSQYWELDIAPISQNTQNWCWAASMEMIMKFHNENGIVSLTDVTQCDLAKQYRFVLKGDTTDDDVCCFDCDADCMDKIDCPGDCANGDCTDLDGSGSQFWNLFVRFAKSKNGTFELKKDNPDYIDHVFTVNGYNSTQRVNWPGMEMTWDDIKHELQACRPFMIFMATRPGIDVDEDAEQFDYIDGNHVVVAKGYDETNGKMNIIANDPWLPCCGGNETIIPYSTFTGFDHAYVIGAQEHEIYDVFATVQDIHPSTPAKNKDCLSCEVLTEAYGNDDFIITDPLGPPQNITSSDQNLAKGNFPPERPRIMSVIERNPKEVLGYQELTDQMNEEYYESYLQEKGRHDADVYFLSFDQLYGRSFLGIKLSTKQLPEVLVQSKLRVKEVVTENLAYPIVSTFQQIGEDLWALKKVSNYTYIRDTIQVTVNGEKSVILSNLRGEDRPQDALNYSLIKFPPFRYEFYSFANPSAPGRAKIHDYLVPAASYKSLKVDRGTAYPARKILRMLSDKVREVVKDNEAPGSSEEK